MYGAKSLPSTSNGVGSKPAIRKTIFGGMTIHLQDPCSSYFGVLQGSKVSTCNQVGSICSTRFHIFAGEFKWNMLKTRKSGTQVIKS